jgi:hypothetical protein
VIDASDLEVTVKDGEVTLSGSAHARAEKRHAEDVNAPPPLRLGPNLATCSGFVESVDWTEGDYL